MNWQTTLNRGRRSETWTKPKAARQAETWVAETSQWLRGDQAALMRYVPEQDNASRWHEATRAGDPLPDIADLMCDWLQAFHNVDATSWDIVTGSAQGLSPTAQLMHHLCAHRADQMRAGTIVTCSPTVMAALAVLAQTSRYQLGKTVAADLLPAEQGTLLLPAALTRNGPAGLPEAPDTQPLRAVTWVREDSPAGGQVRFLDWSDISGDHASTGNAQLDSQVQEHLARTGDRLPPLMFNGEWVAGSAAAEHDAVTAARSHIVAALRESRTHDITWTPETVLNDSPRPVAVRLLAALGDAVTAGLFTATEVDVQAHGSRQNTNAPNTTQVLVLEEPAPDPH